jgi:hypothetical protein
LRRDGQEDWLRTYQRILAEAVVEAPSIEVLWDRYRRSVLYGWLAATTTATMGSKWQPIEVGRLGMARATTTCADLDTVEAIRAAL